MPDSWFGRNGQSLLSIQLRLLSSLPPGCWGREKPVWGGLPCSAPVPGAASHAPRLSFGWCDGQTGPTPSSGFWRQAGTCLTLSPSISITRVPLVDRLGVVRSALFPIPPSRPWGPSANRWVMMAPELGQHGVFAPASSRVAAHHLRGKSVARSFSSQTPLALLRGTCLRRNPCSPVRKCPVSRASID